MLDNKVILITGAARGIGEAAARIFAGYGAKLLLTDVAADAVAKVAEAINAKGGEAISMAVDVTKESEVKAMVDKAVSHFGRLDGAYNNAGIGGETNRTADQTEDNFRTVMEICLFGTWYCTKHEILAMQKTGGGAIVSTSSDAGLSGTPYMSPYGAAKAGIINITQTAAVEYGVENIRINTICPGPIDTPAHKESVEGSDIDISLIFGGMAIKRMGKAEEVAEMAAFLLSDKSGFTTGQAISVDGGFNASFTSS